MTSVTRPEAGVDPGALTYRVDGMDCASCVLKVERMVGALPGTAAVTASFTRQTLTLHLDERRTPRTLLETNLRALGYAPSLLSPAAQPATQPAQAGPDLTGHSRRRAPASLAWSRTTQGRLVITSGVLLAAAWLLGFAEPRFATAGYVAAALLGVWPLARKALASARLGDPFSINMLVSLAAIGAVAIGEAPEGAVVVFFFAVGELLEGVAAGRARAGIQALTALTPNTALLVGAAGLQEVPAAELQVGQTVQVNPGGRVPADGTIVSGTSSLDDSPVTGESVPVTKSPGDHVYAGSINASGVLRVQVNAAAADNTIARIIQLVEEAEGNKAPTARFIDRFSRSYTPGVVLVAALVALLPPLLGGAWHDWLYKGISLLLIGCPCALVLSVPASITSALSAGTRRGLLVKGGGALETIGRVRTVAFDKTGTLTAGQPQVTDIIGLNLPTQDVLRLAAAVETGSSHPLARAITARAAQAGLTLPHVMDAQAIPGRAVTATAEGRALSVASPRHAASLAPLSAALQARLTRLEEQGRTAVLLLDGAQPLGILALRDEPRADARSAIAELRALGVRTVMLTGDNARTGQAIARDLGLEVQADLLPGDKLRVIDGYKTQGGVAMVGDGINDAPALAHSDVGIAMGGGTDVALETADAALLHERVTGVADLVRLSRATMRNIRINLAFALGLKAIFLVTTLLGHTNLWMAVLADTGATALVTANALRLLRWAPHRSAPVPASPAPHPA
ncbi:cadmium-translocating P-type ATPase (plasmid) [Deinococcus taeanensis]|uniref:heavy metal translocating P-type ATPase n=1 Tax=Deinococcus taeanensis TaxID=2737050 RepID=UPI001CDD84D1|nr:heavy metal translocating P-type ATPase [Deinococcus taeanensis]UBV44167.1 cadmium-translocating P-type ATPase [Deinococcus taeanensis]